MDSTQTTRPGLAPSPPSYLKPTSHATPRLVARGAPLIQHSFPSVWVCSTCDAPHSVLEILAGTGEEDGVACACGKPTLQAVYDQFGRIFLFWRDDAAVHDLRDAAKVQEAAWRIWEAGAEPWLEDVLALEAEREKKAMRAGFCRRGSLSSEDSLDVEIAGVECR
jgi:hypothetical protein